MTANPLTFSIGTLPTHANVSALVVAEANFVRNTYNEAAHFFRTHDGLLGTEQQKEDAGIDTVTFPSDATRLDNLKDFMFGLMAYIEGNSPTPVAGMLNLVEQIGGMPG
jgi:hypothetical protein